MSSRTFNVLFLCTGNSARSIMAESILRLQGMGRFEVYSAGSRPAGEVHPYAIELLQRNHYPVENLRSKSWNEFAAADAPRMDFVLTVCDNAKAEACPVWPGQPISSHWGIPDPVTVQGDEASQSKAFADAFLVLNRRISLFNNLSFDKLSGLSLNTELNRIGQA
ncbi:arsenate reductase ArsC [Malikia sp.]|uniref:arsenate reductase ArsC n=1 Tax=Malikia sp. TaxID=2070706 RepID=UPI00262AEEFB|nr:arsenate reductase ArsC [Malikia sp.]MDD2729934.1 arsenate reductase ArsC [Malikia sp.]